MSSLSNAFEIIKHVVQHQAEGMTFTNIIETTQLPRSSLHRLLKELVSLQILTYDNDRKVYRGGLPLATIGSYITSNFNIQQSTRPILKSLHEKLGHVVTLSVLGENTGIYIDKLEAMDFNLRLHSEIGKAFPLHCTAMGKVYLAYAEKTLFDRITKRELKKYTEKTITNTTILKSEMRNILKRGYAIDDEEITRGLTCIGAPIFGINQNIIAAISFTCPSHIYESEDKSAFIKEIIKHADQASLN